MKFAFQKLQLEADSLFALIDTWVEMQLVITEDTAKIIGDGYAYDIAEAFTTLVLDWEATIPLARAELDIPEGAYVLIRSGDMLLACREQRSFPLADRAVVVEVLSVPEA